MNKENIKPKSSSKKLNIIEIYNRNSSVLFQPEDKFTRELNKLNYNGSDMKIARDLWRQCK